MQIAFIDAIEPRRGGGDHQRLADAGFGRHSASLTFTVGKYTLGLWLSCHSGPIRPADWLLRAEGGGHSRLHEARLEIFRLDPGRAEAAARGGCAHAASAVL